MLIFSEDFFINLFCFDIYIYMYIYVYIYIYLFIRPIFIHINLMYSIKTPE